MTDIRALVDKAPAIGIDHQTQRIRVPLKYITEGDIAGVWGVGVSADRVTSRPMAVRRGADVERHAQSVSGIKPRAANLDNIPAWSEIAGTPFRVGFESSACQNYRTRANV